MGGAMSDFLNLHDQVVVVTGAASGMGRAVAIAASREGARLVLSDFDGERLKATAAELTGEVRHQRVDVTRTAEIDSLFELARTDGIMPIVRRTARFNRHRDLIVALLRHPPVRRALFHLLTN